MTVSNQGDARQARWPLALVAMLVVAVAVWFRFRALDGLPFWLDEGYSAYGAEKSFGFIFNILPGYETHPPFYTALLRCWTLLTGTSIYAFRAMGAVAGVAALALYWLAGREAGRLIGRDPRLVALASLAAAALMPSIVNVTRLVRPYALMALAFALGLWAVLRFARILRDQDRFDRTAWTVYLVAQALLFWLHNLGALYVAGLGLALLILCGPLTLMRRFPRAFFGGHALLVAIAVPAFLILIDQAPTWKSSTWLSFNPDALFGNLLGIYGMPAIQGLVCAIPIVIFACLKGGRTAAALILAAAFPVLASLVLTLTITPVFLPRTLVSASVPLVILLGCGVASASLVPRAAFALFLFFCFRQLLAIQALPPEENWHGVARWLESRVQPGDVIYAYPNESALPMHYAAREFGIVTPMRAIPAPVPSKDPTGWFPTGSRGVVSLPQYRLEQFASDPASQRARVIWLLRTGPWKYDRGDGFVTALSRDRVAIDRWPVLKAGEKRGEPIDVIGFARKDATGR